MNRETIEKAVNVYIGYEPEVDESLSTSMRRKAFSDGAEWALSHQWTKVSDRKPEPEEWCLMKVKDSGCILGLGKNVEDSGLPITHWMPIPEIKELEDEK